MNGEDDLTPVEPYPPWKAALARFLDERRKCNFQPGDVISDEWLYSAMGMEMPDDEWKMGRATKARLAFLKQFDSLRAALLREHQIDLVRDIGEGYHVVPPAEQTKVAYHDGIADVRKALGRLSERLTNVDHAQLTNEQRRENAEALAKLSMLETMRRRARRLPAPEPPEE